MAVMERKAADDSNGPIVVETDNITVDVPYPIPSRDNINIKLSQPSIVKMINLQGATVREVSAEGQTIISTDDLSPGVYLLKVINQTQTTQYKVTIDK